MGLRDDDTRRLPRAEDTGLRRRWNDGQKPLSQQTPVQLGLFVGLATLVAGAVWWASDVSSTLKAINSNVQELKDDRKEDRAQLADHETRLRLAESHK